jgi:hypothetical protein
MCVWFSVMYMKFESQSLFKHFVETVENSCNSHQSVKLGDNVKGSYLEST